MSAFLLSLAVCSFSHGLLVFVVFVFVCSSFVAVLVAVFAVRVVVWLHAPILIRIVVFVPVLGSFGIHHR